MKKKLEMFGPGEFVAEDFQQEWMDHRGFLCWVASGPLGTVTGTALGTTHDWDGYLSF